MNEICSVRNVSLYNLESNLCITTYDSCPYTIGKGITNFEINIRIRKIYLQLNIKESSSITQKGPSEILGPSDNPKTAHFVIGPRTNAHLRPLYCILVQTYPRRTRQSLCLVFEP